MLPIRRTAAVLLVLSSAACASSAPSACPEDAGRVMRPEGQGWYHGPLVSVDSSQAAGHGWIRNVMVQVEPEGRTRGRMSFSVGEGTTLLCRSGARLSRAAPLAPGMTVSAKTRMIQESDTAYASADTLIVGPLR
ncbi:hypothetical protein [Longimicrobium sp.]|uniref:hypothetical protein n=1 Tax=Longimicrobium sp. TaxID=2029185 RepID=UPI002E33245C|nr:hypothetical protein [Longimicrobium sp.]HEX6042824.1 hypothetical protein [Longimicrobium sp.]